MHTRSKASSSKVSTRPPTESSSEEDEFERSASPSASPYMPKRHTPTGDSKITPTIAKSQKENLHAKDSGLCLITQQAEPKITIQVCHILPRKTPDKTVKDYKDMWKAKDFSIDSTSNLVSLRADWHASYDANCWAFVPSQEILGKILDYDTKGSYQKPYPGYRTEKKFEYDFVAFPTLKLKIFARYNHDNTDVDIFRHPFPQFPQLRHHSHPYLVIANALPKFREHERSLTKAQFEIFITLLRITNLWENNRSPASPKLLGRKRRMDDPDEGPSDEEDGDKPPKRKRKGERKRKRKEKEKGAEISQEPTAQGPTEGKGKGHQLKADRAKVFYPSPPGSPKPDRIMSWIADVLAAGPLGPVDEDIIPSDGEIPRAPYTGDWHEWHYPWTKPPGGPSKYCSIDWAMHMFSIKLTMDYSDLDDSNDESSSS